MKKRFQRARIVSSFILLHLVEVVLEGL